MRCLPLCAQYPAEGRFTSDVHAFVSQHGHNARRRYIGETGFVSHFQDTCALVGAKRVSRHRPHGLRALVFGDHTVTVLPTLRGTHVNTGHFAGLVKPRTCLIGSKDSLGYGLAIFEADYSPSPMALLKIVATFFDSTNNAAVSAKALFLRLTSRSSSLMRRRHVKRLRNVAAVGKRVGRNDPCPCGSGKKFKKCCIERAA